MAWTTIRDYETLRLIEVLRKSRTYCCSRASCWWIVPTPLPLKTGLTPDDYLQVFGDNIGKFDGELHLYPRNNVIPHKTALREIPVCVLKNNFVAEVKDLQQQSTHEEVAEWVSAPSCKLQTFC